MSERGGGIRTCLHGSAWAEGLSPPRPQILINVTASSYPAQAVGRGVIEGVMLR